MAKTSEEEDGWAGKRGKKREEKVDWLLLSLPYFKALLCCFFLSTLNLNFNHSFILNKGPTHSRSFWQKKREIVKVEVRMKSHIDQPVQARMLIRH